jgi:histone chaperone ASF1
MSIVNISDISVLANPARFHDPYVFKVTFECLAPLKDGACPLHIQTVTYM